MFRAAGRNRIREQPTGPPTMSRTKARDGADGAHRMTHAGAVLDGCHRRHPGTFRAAKNARPEATKRRMGTGLARARTGTPPDRCGRHRRGTMNDRREDGNPGPRHGRSRPTKADAHGRTRCVIGRPRQHPGPTRLRRAKPRSRTARTEGTTGGPGRHSQGGTTRSRTAGEQRTERRGTTRREGAPTATQPPVEQGCNTRVQTDAVVTPMGQPR